MAMAAPIAPSLKKSIRMTSTAIFIIQAIIMKYSGVFESPIPLKIPLITL